MPKILIEIPAGPFCILVPKNWMADGYKYCPCFDKEYADCNLFGKLESGDGYFELKHKKCLELEKKCRNFTLT